MVAKKPLRRSSKSAVGEHRRKIEVFVTPEEHALIKTKALASGLSMSRLMIESTLNAARYEMIDAGLASELHQLLGDYRHKLAGIANNVNQIAKQANTSFEVPANTDNALRVALQVMEHVNEIMHSVER